MTQDSLHHIIVVGGGAGGLELATRLGKTLGKKKKAQITLIDANRTHIWKPLLHEVAAGTFDAYENQIEYMAQAKQNHFHFRLGKMNGLNRETRTVIVASTHNSKGEEIIPERQFTYDTLIIAVGSVSNDFAIEGVKEHCMFLDTNQEAESFQNKLLEAYIRANSQNAPLKPGQLDVVIAGAGATGIELSAQLHKVSRLFTTYGLDQINPSDINISIVEAADRILPGLPPKLSQATEDQLSKLNISVLKNERVIKVTKTELFTDTGRIIPACIKVWAAGIKAPSFLKNIDGLETNHINQLVVKQNLQTTVDENIFSMGDCAACPWPEMDKNVPPRAQSAHQQAALLVKTMKRRLAGKTLPDFKYYDYGSLVSLGKYSTVGNLMGNLTGSVMVEGFMARMVYLSLYKLHQFALFGFYRTMFLSIAHLFRASVHPEIKLH
ncbi:MAG: NAD(P)/FAD-dependent oxidoreductase [Gammaproteobacteria bacterium]|nr:NAD(P)/FAD-dependent oxidoreductase [Gammaproteobacteria bacterium]